MRRALRRWTSALLALWMAGSPDGVFAAPAPERAPSAALLEPAVEIAAGLPRLHSLLVSWRGEVILERYFHGARASRPANIKSASKSVLSALVGIAIERGLLPGVHAPIGPFFPSLLGAGADPRKREITIEDLLTMRSGLASTSNRNYGAWVRSPNWVRHVLSRPLLNPPGIEMDYSTGNSHLLSAILTKVSGRSTWEFARQALAAPLATPLSPWPRDPQGIYFGGNDMLLTPRQMLAFGELYRNRGLANGRQVVPVSWVEASFVPRTRSHWSQRLYGYGWWMDELAGYRTCYAWGFGGQYIAIVPDLELVIVTTSSPDVGEGRRGHRSAVYDLMERLVINPVASALKGPSQITAGR
jgi:CubicO group peptidase (beta-lactamase class C family)